MAAPDPGPRPGDLTPWAARSTAGQRFRRGLTGRCPRCGESDIADGFFDLAEHCPSCGWAFEREEGYWVGAMVVLFAAVEVLYALLLLVWIVSTWPDVSWTPLMYVGIAMNASVPFLLYRWSRSTWMGMHSAFVPAELERDEATRTGSA